MVDRAGLTADMIRDPLMEQTVTYNCVLVNIYHRIIRLLMIKEVKHKEERGKRKKGVWAW